MGAFFEELRLHPVIAAARDEERLLLAAQSPAAAVFLLGGSILKLPQAVRLIQNAKKRAFVHVDLIEGLGHDAAAIDWIWQNCAPDGVISTRQPLLRRAHELGMLTVQRVFVMDSSSIQSGVKLIKSFQPDMIEVLPGLMPKLIAQLQAALPGAVVIAGGLLTETAEVEAALAAGALAVSSSAQALW